MWEYPIDLFTMCSRNSYRPYRQPYRSWECGIFNGFTNFKATLKVLGSMWMLNIGRAFYLPLKDHIWKHLIQYSCNLSQWSWPPSICAINSIPNNNFLILHTLTQYALGNVTHTLKLHPIKWSSLVKYNVPPSKLFNLTRLKQALWMHIFRQVSHYLCDSSVVNGSFLFLVDPPLPPVPFTKPPLLTGGGSPKLVDLVKCKSL